MPGAIIKNELLDSFYFPVPDPWPEHNDARWIYRKKYNSLEKLICT